MFKYPDLRSKRRTKYNNASHANARHTPHESAIVEHVTRRGARPTFVIHEVKSELVHLDVHVVPPGEGHNFWFLFTTGMSARPMKKPHDTPGSRLAEVSILLPPDWRLSRESWRRDTRWFWPIRELRGAALLPHRHQTWLGHGHTIMPVDVARSGERSPSMDASTRLSSLLVLGSNAFGDGFDTIKSGTEQIDLLALVPLYPEELEYKIEHGAYALIGAFEAAGISDVIDPERPSAFPVTAVSSPR